MSPSIPQQRIAVAGDAHDVEARAVAVALLVGADRHFRNMRVHGAVGEHEHDVGAAGAAVAPGFQFDRGEIGNEIGLPHVVARPHRDEIAFAGKILVLAGPRRRTRRSVSKMKRSSWNVFITSGRSVVETISARSRPRAVEMAMARIERDREQAARSPFEASLAAVGELDLGRAGAFQHIDHILIEMALRRASRRPAGCRTRTCWRSRRGP